MEPNPLALHEFHHALNARFDEVNGREVVASHGDPAAEHHALRHAAGVLDFSFRGRLCLTGADRQRFLNGQVTNNLASLGPGRGCYAFLPNEKGKIQTDLNIFVLENEILLDIEPGWSSQVAERLEKYIIADDVQVVDASPFYGLLTVQGPLSAGVMRQIGLELELPASPFHFVTISDPVLGEIYIVNQPRLRSAGFDLFVPTPALAAVADKLVQAAKSAGGRPSGWEAFEIARMEAGIPRFGLDMDESNLPPETGLEAQAISYSKGCYIGQEILARIRTYGQVAKAWRGLLLPDQLETLPVKGDKLFKNDKDAGYITSAVHSPAYGKNIAFGYVRREVNETGAELTCKSAQGDFPARIIDLPLA